MERRGQMFLISALIIVVILISLEVVYVQTEYRKEDVQTYDLVNEIDFEASQVIANGIYQSSSNQVVEENIKELVAFYAKANSDVDILMLYGDDTEVKTLVYESEKCYQQIPPQTSIITGNVIYPTENEGVFLSWFGGLLKSITGKVGEEPSEDFTSPTISVSSPYKNKWYNSASGEIFGITITASDNVGVDHCKIDSRTVECSTSSIDSLVISNLGFGSKTIEVCAYDAMNNEACTSLSFTIDDGVGPDCCTGTTITGANAEGTYSSLNPPVVTPSCSDNYSPVDSSSIKVDCSGSTCNGNLPAGDYTVKVSAKDKAGVSNGDYPGSCKTVGTIKMISLPGSPAPTGGSSSSSTTTVTNASTNVSTCKDTNPIRGDMNGDGVVNNQDINPFTLAISNPSQYSSTYPCLNRTVRGDINRDGYFNNQDITEFTRFLVQPTTTNSTTSSGSSSTGSQTNQTNQTNPFASETKEGTELRKILTDYKLKEGVINVEKDNITLQSINILETNISDVTAIQSAKKAEIELKIGEEVLNATIPEFGKARVGNYEIGVGQLSSKSDVELQIVEREALETAMKAVIEVEEGRVCFDFISTTPKTAREILGRKLLEGKSEIREINGEKKVKVSLGESTFDFNVGKEKSFFIVAKKEKNGEIFISSNK